MDLTNQLLIAMPAIADPNFHRSVTLICAHTDKGAMGLTINQPMDVTIEDILKNMKVPITTPDAASLKQQMVLRGGPIQPQNVFIIHYPPGDWDTVLCVSDTIGVAASYDIIDAIAKGNGPEHALIVLGYAGWGAGQLEQEYMQNAWLSCPINNLIVFEADYNDRWEQATRVLGVDPNQLSDLVGHA